MRRSIPALVLFGLVFVACANSSTPGDGSGTGTGKVTDAGNTDETPNYGDDTTPTQDSGTTPETDSGANKEGGLPIYDAGGGGGGNDSGGGGTPGACDDSGGTYSAEYIFAVGLGAQLGICADGCKSDECCFDPGAGDPVCLKL